MLKILVAGGSGLIGSNVLKKLKQKNHETVLLSTRKNLANNENCLYWDPENGIFPVMDLGSFDACLNLCGAPIFDKAFTEQRKEELKRSRTLPIQFLATQFKQAGVTLPYFISSSATGFYPNICLNEINEASTTGQGFIPELVRQWEEVVNDFADTAFKRCIIRIGIVFSSKGGFLQQLAKPIRMFAGAVPGSGKQMISWIHEDDLADMIIEAIEKQLQGIFNAAAPQPNTLENISKQVAATLHRPLFLPHIPEWVLKLAFGSERYKLLLTSQKVSSKKIQSEGFRFRYHSSAEAIHQLLSE